MKKTRNILFTLLSTSVFFLSSQAQNALFSKRLLNFSTPATMFPTKDGGFLMTGVDTNFKTRIFNMVLTKISSTGDVVYAKKVANLPSDFFPEGAICKETTTGKLIFSYWGFNVNSQIHLLNPDLTSIWSYHLKRKEDYFEDIIELKNGNFLAIVNSHRFNPNGIAHTNIILFDPMGNIILQKRLKSNLYDLAIHEAKESSDGNVILSVQNSAALIKINLTNAEVIWSKELRTNSIDIEESTHIDQQGNIYLFTLKVDNGFSKYSTSILKLDNNGNAKWRKIIDSNFPLSTVHNEDNTFSFIATWNKGSFIKMDSDGKILSQTSYPHRAMLFYLSSNERDKPNLIRLKSGKYVYLDLMADCKNKANLLLQQFSTDGMISCSKLSQLPIRDTVCAMENFNKPQPSDIDLLNKTAVLTFADFSLNIKNYTRFCYQDTLRPIICEGEFVSVGKHKYTVAGIYSDTIPTANHECDSIVFTKLTVNKTYKTKQQKTICKSESFQIGNVSYTKSGVYETLFKSRTACDSLVVTDLQVIDIQVEISKDTLVEMGQKAQLWARSTKTDIEWKWSPTTTLNCSYCPMPEAVPIEFTRYILSATSSEGCSVEKDVRISVRPCERVFLPTVFSPNGDNINDIFQVFAAPCIKRVKYFMIFDRWGNKIHEAKDFLPNDVNFAWDGTFQGTKAQGVFTYLLQIERLDGTLKVINGDVLVLD